MRREAVVATSLILLFSCASPTLKEQQLTNVKGVKDILKAEKAEYMDLSPTETFALGDFICFICFKISYNSILYL